MDYADPRIANVASELKNRLNQPDFTGNILHAVELKALYAEIPTRAPDQRGSFGKQINQLRAELEQLTADRPDSDEKLAPIDVTAPFDTNTPLDARPQVLRAGQGSRHPLTTELDQVLDIFYRMGFTVQESRQIDDDYHMFGSLNFPEGHPARDDYDTFMTVETDRTGKPLIAPAHTSTMQNRALRENSRNLQEGRPIAVVLPGRVFRNEDLDARHEHTFYQFEGVYVDRGINAGNLLATFKTFLSTYYQQDIEIRSQPFYFPFTEPSFELALSCPFCHKQGCRICSYTGWIELLGMGMIHPNVLKEAGIDSSEFTGFAWGCGLERLVMMKYGIQDIRHFESAKLDFLRQFS